MRARRALATCFALVALIAAASCSTATVSDPDAAEVAQGAATSEPVSAEDESVSASDATEPDANDSIDADAASATPTETEAVEVVEEAALTQTAELAGYRTALTDSGQRLAVASRAGEAISEGAIVTIFEFDGADWTQIGQPISQQNVEVDNLAFSEDGEVLVVSYRDEPLAGQVWVYEFENDEWTTVGEPIVGQTQFGFLGQELAIASENGRLVYLSLDGARTIVHTVSEWGNPGSAIQQIDLEAHSGELAGGALAASSDGQWLLLGAPFSNVNSPEGGQARLYQFDGTQWVQAAEPIEGPERTANTGGAVAISDDGQRIVVGANGSDEGGTGAGKVQVFDQAADGWNAVGQDIIGAEMNWLGDSVAITADGSRLAIGAPRSESDRGEVLIYDLVDDSWELRHSIAGIVEEGLLGSTDISLADDGKTLVATAPGFFDVENDRQSVELVLVFSLS